MPAYPAYKDRWIECDDGHIRIRGYYFPWGTKQIAYGDIHSVRTVALSALRGRARIWGTANPGYWASLDPQRPRKHTGLVLDLGHRIKPFITPDDVDAVRQAIREHTTITEVDDGAGPII
jgi:hypothetical protein